MANKFSQMCYLAQWFVRARFFGRRAPMQSVLFITDRCNAFLGGISKNYGTNYILSASDYVVIEADEFDRSFHWLRPWSIVPASAGSDERRIGGECRSRRARYH